jgi:putative restriction endonuclease
LASRPGYGYAVVGDYLPFDQPVPFSSDGKYAEAPLRAIRDPSLSSEAQGRRSRLWKAAHIALGAKELNRTLRE